MRSFVADALKRDLKHAIAQRDYYLMRCRALEEQFGMTSGDFLVAFESGELGDDEDYFEWFGMKQVYDSWEHRVRIASGALLGSR